MPKNTIGTIQPVSGITKWTSWLKKDISLPSRQGRKKLAFKKQVKVIQLFHNLFTSGFTLTESLAFLERSRLLESRAVDQMKQCLLAGQGLAQMMGAVGFSDAIVTQLALADYHGNVTSCLEKIQTYLSSLSLVRKKMIEVATYPLILLSFLMIIMLGLRHYLLPQLEAGNLATLLISYSPQIFLGTIMAIAVLGLVAYFVVKPMSKLKLCYVLARVPGLSSFVQLYLTAYYAREWGSLLGQGLELTQVVSLMQEQPSRLFQELGQDLEQALLSGQTFHEKVATYPFFRQEMSLMIEYGEVKSRLGSELEIYAQETWEIFFAKITKTTQLIQPFIFMLVALIIVMIYAAMLLPMYQNMELSL
ncbi:competence type IV pilus assembly protein ComGB [Streptococcus caprae]|uniref:Competence type IV pilus assembly protein ComGB n=1 Tax=Streptococcus caprae TaxID=1640501 RepID=A0ABV8CWD9_9STRE